MQKPMQPYSIRNLGVYGLLRQSAVDDNLTPDGGVKEVINFHFDRLGACTVRPGMTALGGTVGVGTAGGDDPCWGLFNSQNSTMCAVFGTTLKRYNGSAWASELTGMTGSANVRFVDFANRTIILDGTYSSIRVWDGTTGNTVTSGNPINPDQFVEDGSVITQTLRASMGEVYKSRVYFAGDPTTPSRLFFSSVISSAGNITWTPSTDFVDINPGDGESISGLKRYSLELEVFKPNYIYRFRTSGTDPDPLVHVGTRSQESIIEGNQGLYFWHDTGAYQYSGGYPVLKSVPIQDVVDAVPYSHLKSIAAWKDNNHIYWSLGNLTIGDTATEQPVFTNNPNTYTWKNTVVRYTESADLWTVYSYASDIRRGATFNNGTTLTTVVGLDNGVVSTINSGTTDNGEMIKYRMVTKWYEWEGIQTKKLINKLCAIAEKEQDSHVFYQIDGKITEWIDMGQIKDFITYFEQPTKPFHRIRFKISGVTKQEAPIFLGLEVFEGINEGYVQ